MLLLCDVGMLATVARRYGCIQKPGCLLWGRSTQFRLILELEGVWEEKNCITITNVDTIRKDRQSNRLIWAEVVSKHW